MSWVVAGRTLAGVEGTEELFEQIEAFEAGTGEAVARML